jgi:hypothetical protein
MWPFRRRTEEEKAQISENALFDDELFERVYAIAAEEARELIDAGRVEMRVQQVGEDAEVPGDISLQPTRPDATGILLWTWGDTVAFSAGGAGAMHESWTTADADWEDWLRQKIRCVRDGHYSETVSSGRLSPLKVRCRFGGVMDGRGRELIVRYGSTLASSDGPMPMPPTGEFSYDPW